MNFNKFMLIDSNQSQVHLDDELQFAKLLINQTTDAAFCIGENAEFLYINDATCNMTGYSREELLFMTLHDIDIELLTHIWLEQWGIIKSQGSLNCKSRYQTKNGRVFIVDVTITYVEYQGVKFGCGFARRKAADESEDIKEELQQTESELEASVALLRSTLECTSNGILAVNFEGEILCYNQRFLDMWRLPKEVKLSRKCHRAKVFFESQVKQPQVFLEAVWEMPSQSDRESYDILELKDGRIFAHYSEPQRLNNKIIGRVWSIWDITESRKTEEALRLNEARFRTLAETTEASIFLIQGKNLCYANPAAEILTGYTRRELLSNFNLDQLIKYKRRRQVHKQEGGSFCQYQEMLIVTKNGTESWLACTVGILDQGQDFTGNEPVELITAIDITDYKRAESEVRHALDQAKRLSELRERFVSMLCHQFRTPLNVVSFSADLLRRNSRQWTEEKNRSYLDLIQDAVKQISQLLDDILLFGKAEAEKLECQPRELDLARFCFDIVAQMQFLTDNQKIIYFDNQASCISARVDPKLLQHILTNLLSNAVKYSPAASVVTFELTFENQDAIFKIKDKGIGIPAVDQQQIFDPFSRGSNVDHIPGTGLGLSIVKMLVDLHGGKIHVESEISIGTMFTITLPNVL
ncbi:MAG: PAS domain S-box protein [Cyanomargarita calcarea GSE-NOS-MK-12-04C]|jgi:PAS domain S-box-containing protein|uniref:histidine kinase n=1 Tax=Cyanomargarita calcarea GSE-NOS-MK-12-04C TaxID=2839659 RepID=A0A951UTV9_9CYAN|nr:PAS domain S-box protein [Cyanomargarita calcarea GSE-NOS-MK-12-04C]